MGIQTEKAERDRPPVYVRISEIQQGAGMWITYQSEEELPCNDIDFVGPVSISLKLTNAETRILVQGQATGKVQTECARCNEEFPLPLEIEIEEGFVSENSPEADVTGIDVYEVLTYKEDRVPLDEMLRQNFLAAVPMQPICRGGDCKGLCDQCGLNLNNDSCDCQKEEIDPRWAALGELKKRSSKPSLN
jgi:uncharacterized protein